MGAQDETRKRVLIVGAGIAGLMAGRVLREHEIGVLILDKGANLGGRMATRCFDPLVFDHGAQFFTVRDFRFAQVVEDLTESNVVTEWCRGFDGSTNSSHEEQGHPRFRGVEGMSQVARALAKGLSVRTNRRISEIRIEEGKWLAFTEGETLVRADALILTPPVPQSLALLDAGEVTLPEDLNRSLRQIEYNPCLALLVQLDGPSRVPPPGGLQFSEGPISWIADNHLKGISPQAVTLTIHASPSYSRDRYGAGEEEISKDLLRVASEWTGDSKVVLARLHRWRYSQPAAVYPERCLMAHGDPPLVFAGDAFGGPRIEGAALSGMAAAQTLLSRLHSIV